MKGINAMSVDTIVLNEEKTTQQNKTIIICGYSIWRLLSYFFIYSFLGFIMETTFGLATKGVIESRKSMLYGPFCCIYGMGAVFLLCIPKKIKKNNYLLFIYGMIIGSIVEYVVSLVGELVFNLKWWDYSDYPFNINGRICLLFTIIWGLCTLALNRLFNPTVDKFIQIVKSKISPKTLQVFITVFTFLIIIDNIVSSFALKMFYTRLIHDNLLENVAGAEKYYDRYLTMYKNSSVIKTVTDKCFSNKAMLTAFPNLKITTKNGDSVWIRDVLTDIQPYYIKVFEPKQNLFYKK